MAAREFIVIAAAFAAGAVHADTPTGSELHFELLADALLLPPISATLTPATTATEKELFSLAPQRQLQPDPFVPHLTEDRVSEFFRTGILLSDHKEHPLKKLSVGPCEGGQLLNLRTNW